MRPTRLFALGPLLVAALCAVASAQPLVLQPAAPAEPYYLRYTIPFDAQRKQMLTRPGLPNTFAYTNWEGHMVGVEMFTEETNKLIGRVIYKDDKLHGVQLQWYENGALQSSKPYKNGVMEGIFREWDDKGNLVCCSPSSMAQAPPPCIFPMAACVRLSNTRTTRSQASA